MRQAAESPGRQNGNGNGSLFDRLFQAGLSPDLAAPDACLDGRPATVGAAHARRTLWGPGGLCWPLSAR